ncbi:MAG: PLP-dependent aminotransferase family protein [Actinomycetota bacterium]
MPKSWATFGFDLHLDRTGIRVRAGLEDALRDAVQAGRLAPGSRLPSSRTLAVDLEIARNTVADAYGQLVAEGWLTAQPGSGTRVAERFAGSVAAAVRVESTVRRVRYDLRPGSPDLAAFPRSAWLSAGRRALDSASYDVLGYGDPRGTEQLRVALAAYLARARGVRVTPERIVVCSGFTQGLGLLCQVLAARGATSLAVESCGHESHRQLVTAAGLGLRSLSVDSDGADVSALGRDDAVLLTPAHQWPLGVALASGRRTRAVQWAAESGGVIIEDDYDGEFRYDRKAIGAMQALAPEHVVYAGSTSKSLAPGLRLGWLVLPAALLDDVVSAKTMADRQTGVFEQLTLAEFISTSSYDRHLRSSRLAYRRRRDQLLAALSRQAPQVRVTGISAGLHALLELPAGWDENDIVGRAAARGLALEGLAPYYADRGRHGAGLVVGYATPPQHAFTGAVSRLCATLKEAA